MQYQDEVSCSYLNFAASRVFIASRIDLEPNLEGLFNDNDVAEQLQTDDRFCREYDTDCIVVMAVGHWTSLSFRQELMTGTVVRRTSSSIT